MREKGTAYTSEEKCYVRKGKYIRWGRKLGTWEKENRKAGGGKHLHN
jgi:hypothetical protein